MILQPQITLKDIPHSDAVEAKIRDKTAKLDMFHSRITGCRVTIESTQRRQHQGKLFSIRIDVTVPGSEIVINKVEHEDIYVAVRDAFDAAKRKLEEHERRQRGDVKTHEEPPVGRIVTLYAEQGYGFIETLDKREIYFHRNSVLGDGFDKLKVGSGVSFIEEQGKEGPQAMRVAAR